MEKSYKKIDRIYGSLIEVSGVTGVQFGESVEITGDKGEKREGKVIRIHRDKVTVQVYESTLGMSTINSTVRFKHDALQIPLTKDILGRVLDGLGRPRDEGGKIFSRDKSGINPQPINPVARQYPKDFIQTGISSIDGLITLIRGQKLPIFSGNGMSHNKLAAQIVRQAKIKGGKADDFAVVFAAVGVTHDDGDFFKKEFMHSDAMDRVVMFVNYADDPIAERINTPRTALTVAEYLAFEHEMEILVVMSDLTSYGEALREVSAAREEVPSRKGYPGYLYSDLASLYERAGMLKNQKGSITFLPMLTMPNDDIAHPIPDLTGFITEGQIVLGRDLFQNNIYPPVSILPSLSRLMKDGIGEGFTRADHPDVSSQLFASYSRVQEVRSLAQIIGEDDLSETDKKYLEFGKEFEHRFLAQDMNENREIEDTLDLAWKLLKILPVEELTRVDPEQIQQYYIQG